MCASPSIVYLLLTKLNPSKIKYNNLLETLHFLLVINQCAFEAFLARKKERCEQQNSPTTIQFRTDFTTAAARTSNPGRAMKDDQCLNNHKIVTYYLSILPDDFMHYLSPPLFQKWVSQPVCIERRKSEMSIALGTRLLANSFH